ncbi:MAG: IS3 family transposase [Acidimicrobiaceae bacterium]|nr:IS3 family transposase [Acidimicrobiaceae bacterium]
MGATPIHTASGGAHGSPRVTAELRSRGRCVNVKRVARAHESPPDHRHPPAAPQAHHHPSTPLARAAGPALSPVLARGSGPAWCSGITYVCTGEGWLYLAV